MAALAGADAWSGGGGAALEVRGGAGADRGPFEVWGSGTLEGVTDPAGTLLLDQLRLAGEWRPRGVVAPWAALGASGSVAAAWFDAIGTLGGEVDAGRIRVALAGGGGVRVAGATVGPEALAQARVRGSIGPLALYTGASGRWLGGDLPPFVADVGQWLALGEQVRVEGGAVLSVAPASDDVAVAGLAAPGTLVLQGVLAGSLALSERWSARLEVGPESAWGTVPYQRIRALGGIRADLGPRGPRGPIVEAEGGATRFELRAPDAEVVEVLGAFSEWRPLAMQRDGGRWVVEVPIPPGSWEFVYRVDGETVVPPMADRYVPDGFGGTNGVVVVARP